MLFRTRQARSGEGFDQFAFMVDPWEVNLLDLGIISRETSRALNQNDLGLWIITAWPAFATTDARQVPLPPDQPAKDARTDQPYVYYRRPIDSARAERWANGPEFQVTNLHKD